MLLKSFFLSFLQVNSFIFVHFLFKHLFLFFHHFRHFKLFEQRHFNSFSNLQLLLLFGTHNFPSFLKCLRFIRHSFSRIFFLNYLELQHLLGFGSRLFNALEGFFLFALKQSDSVVQLTYIVFSLFTKFACFYYASEAHACDMATVEASV